MISSGRESLYWLEGKIIEIIKSFIGNNWLRKIWIIKNTLKQINWENLYILFADIILIKLKNKNV